MSTKILPKNYVLNKRQNKQLNMQINNFTLCLLQVAKMAVL